MSSAILYLAIVAIWACVLIPRWLRRDSARGAAAPAALESPVTAESGEAAADAGPGDEDEAGDEDESYEQGQPPVPVAAPVRMEESRRRMLAARRRLLLMLIGLEIAAIALAVLSLAAAWVVVPPTVMLGGYLLLLREAAQADAERAQYEAELAVQARKLAQERAQAPRAVRTEETAAESVPAAAAELAAKFAAAPVPADYEDAGPGRDFAPGLAGKYTTSNADADAADDEYYGYEVPRLRAVGD